MVQVVIAERRFEYRSHRLFENDTGNRAQEDDEKEQGGRKMRAFRILEAIARVT